MNVTVHEAENILPNACDDHPYSSQPNPELLVTPTPLEPSSLIALTQPDPVQSQPASSNQDMELETDEASAEYTTVTYKKRRHSSDSVVLKTDVQPPDHPRGLTVIFTPINPQESLMKLNMKKVSDLLELHCPECILMLGETGFPGGTYEKAMQVAAVKASDILDKGTAQEMSSCVSSLRCPKVTSQGVVEGHLVKTLKAQLAVQPSSVKVVRFHAVVAQQGNSPGLESILYGGFTVAYQEET
ncbi:hypothetical protein HPB47_026830 [Ixodes persulcatus]|uniref:Uncharacterized protein n=1 Tax=Ixodes persulcatus TaxID=34615 RepID=A0AC60PZY0_IXOPE|nr:hypothetical protein HPB47_026830 [Ixodes persulcatus]